MALCLMVPTPPGFSECLRYKHDDHCSGCGGMGITCHLLGNNV